jgi:hypothetical protein
VLVAVAEAVKRLFRKLDELHRRDLDARVIERVRD